MTTTRPTAPTRPGMSLLEVLIALAIFLMSLAAIAQLIDIGTNRASDTVLQNTGTRLAQSKMAELEAGVVDPSSGGAGTFDDEPEWQWSAEPGASEVPNVYPVTVRVWREVRGTRFEITLSQMVLDPLAVGSAAEAAPPTDAATTGTGTTGTTTGTGSGP